MCFYNGDEAEGETSFHLVGGALGERSWTCMLLSEMWFASRLEARGEQDCGLGVFVVLFLGYCIVDVGAHFRYRRSS